MLWPLTQILFLEQKASSFLKFDNTSSGAACHAHQDHEQRDIPSAPPRHPGNTHLCSHMGLGSLRAQAASNQLRFCHHTRRHLSPEQGI
jgi:hypothetical protein